MPKLTYTCPICSKELKLKEEITLDGIKLFSYTCGHVFSKRIELAHLETLDFSSVDGSGKTAREYQKTGVEFIIESGFNAIIGDQQRLGKTPQSLLALKNFYKERTPCLILVRSANLWQWTREYKVWCSALPNGIFPILSTKSWIPPGFDTYIISMDTFGSQGSCTCGHRYHEEKCGNKKCECKIFQSDGQSVLDKLKKISFKLIIADEAHSFKNTESNRSQALVDFVRYLNTGESLDKIYFRCPGCQEEWTEEAKTTYDKRIGHTVVSKHSRCPQCLRWHYQQSQKRDAVTPPEDRPCGLILLTGTAIKNRADEFFVPLNLVAPEKVNSLTSFQNQWLEQNEKGKFARVKEWKQAAFKEFLKPYFLRREKEDVYTDLPPLNKIFTIIEPDKDSLAKQYNKILDKLEETLAQKANPSYWDLADNLMALRRITGMMKVMWTADYLEASLLDSDNQRYAIGIHHESVRDILYFKLGQEQNCLKLSGEDNKDRKDWVMRKFETSPQRVLIINMLAGGVGMDFHYCNNVLVLERQWNYADEQQFEYRFYNPDKSIKKDSTNIEYVIAKGTIDEWWHDMVLGKEQIFGETIGTNWVATEDPQTFRALAEKTVANRL